MSELEFKTLFRPEVLGCERMRDQTVGRENSLRLDKNERLMPFPAKAWTEFQASIRPEDLSSYMDLEPTYARLAEILNVSRESLLITHGSDLAIKTVIESTIAHEDEVVLTVPGFAMYDVYTRLQGGIIRSVPVRDTWAADVGAIISQLSQRTKLVVVENPNGFLGTSIIGTELATLAQSAADVNSLLVIDEAYAGMSDMTADSVLLNKSYQNVVIIKTFSKLQGLAGLRFGYLYGRPEVIDALSAVRPMHEISSLTSRAAIWVMNHPEMQEDYVAELRISKKYLINEAYKLGFTVRNTDANFVLLRVPEPVTDLVEEALVDNNILIRRPFRDARLAEWRRITVGTLADSEKLVKALNAARKRMDPR